MLVSNSKTMLIVSLCAEICSFNAPNALISKLFPSPTHEIRHNLSSKQPINLLNGYKSCILGMNDALCMIDIRKKFFTNNKHFNTCSVPEKTTFSQAVV